MTVPLLIQSSFPPATSEVPTPTESALEVSKRLTELLAQAESEGPGRRLPDDLRERIADTLEILRSRLRRKAERDPRSLFELDERLIELMDRVEDATEDRGEPPPELIQEIHEYLEAFRGKVDRIAGYWRWQESIAEICAREAERFEARSKAAAGRLERLKSMLVAFMLPRGLKKLDGEKASIGVQRNSTASLVIDTPSQIGENFFERSFLFTKAELRELITLLPGGEVRERMEATISGDGWEINSTALRSAITSDGSITAARLMKGHHVRLR